MPIRHWIEPERRRVRAEVWGSFTIEDIVATVSQAARHPDFRPGFDVLSDQRRVERPISVVQVDQTVAHIAALAEHYGGARWAAVVGNPASYGMMRMLSVLAEEIPMTVRVFESMDEAEEWLDAPEGGRAPDPPGASG